MTRSLDRRDYMSLTTKDSRIVWTAPEDKTYYLRLTDVQGNGGPSFVYFLTCRVAQPDFVLWCEPDDKANLGPGCSTTWHLHLERLHGLKGPVQVEVQGLPDRSDRQPVGLHRENWRENLPRSQ